ncbi:MAG: in Carlsberg [Bacillales bacterium]|jgi:subtilisin|nr:in Carlsberg [Bacillales bacterium]
MEFKVSGFKVLEIIEAEGFLKTASTNAIDNVEYGVRLIGAQKEWEKTKGAGIKVAVLDTGIDYNHQDLKDRFKGGVNFTTSDINDYMDRQGHGTHCAGVIGASINYLGIVGVAPEVELYAVKVLSDSGQGTLEWIIQGLEWCIENGIHVVSMSLGAPGFIPSLYNAIKKAYDAGIVLVAAAGNEGAGQDTVGYPASFDEVISVAAVDSIEHKGSFSSTSVEVDVSAAGVDVVSTFPNGKYARLSGTSMACPHIAGAVALIQADSLQKTGKMMKPHDVLSFLAANSKDEGISGRDNEFGYGLFSFNNIK